MKTKIQNLGNNFYKLVIDQSGVAPNDKAVLARITLYEGTGCWSIEDVRLSKYGAAGQYFCIGADQYWASFDAKTSQEATHVRSLLREYKESTQAAPGGYNLAPGATRFEWCTYNGLVPGRTSMDLSGYPIDLVNGAPLLHSRKDAQAYLKTAAEFWAAWPHDAADDDIVKKASAVKIDNPLRQLSESELRFKISQMVREAIPRGPTVAALNAVPSAGHTPSSASSVYSCISDEHLCGFTPTARFGRLVTPSNNNSELKLPHHANRKATFKTFAEDWLLLEKDGELFVDLLKGTEVGRGYGLNPRAPRLLDVLLPSDVYDEFKRQAGALWPLPVTSKSDVAATVVSPASPRTRRPH